MLFLVFFLSMRVYATSAVGCAEAYELFYLYKSVGACWRWRGRLALTLTLARAHQGNEK